MYISSLEADSILLRDVYTENHVYAEYTYMQSNLDLFSWHQNMDLTTTSHGSGQTYSKARDESRHTVGGIKQAFVPVPVNSSYRTIVATILHFFFKVSLSALRSV